MFLIEIFKLLYYMSAFGFVGLAVGSLFDRGRRGDGNIRGDLPSSVGILLGMLGGAGYYVYQR